MFNHFVQSFDLQSIERRTNSDTIFSIRNGSLLAEKRRRARTFSDFDRTKTSQSRKKDQETLAPVFVVFFR